MRRISYANVTATLALFVALGGTSYAVTALPRNSVGTSQLKAHAVTKAKLASGLSLVGPRGATGPAGTAGTAGAAGAAGAPGIAGVVTITAGESTPGFGSASAACPVGKRVIGGGGWSLSGGALIQSIPFDSGLGWSVRAPSAFAYAICATVA